MSAIVKPINFLSIKRQCSATSFLLHKEEHASYPVLFYCFTWAFLPVFNCFTFYNVVTINNLIRSIIYIFKHRVQQLLVWNNALPHIRNPPHNRWLSPAEQEKVCGLLQCLFICSIFELTPDVEPYNGVCIISFISRSE
jgi:hypothetical protein